MKNKLKEYIRKQINKNCSFINLAEEENIRLREMLIDLQYLIDIKSKLEKRAK